MTSVKRSRSAWTCRSQNVRSAEEVEQWLARDPLKLARDRLLEEGVSEEDIAARESSVEALIQEAVRLAVEAPYPEPQTDAATEFRP